MNWLAKINLSVVVTRLGPFKSAVFLVALIGLCLFIGYRLGNFYHHYQVSTLTKQKARLDELYRQQAQQVERIHTLEVELAVEQLANQSAQLTLKETAELHFQVKKQLAFYEKVMAPEKGAGGLVIDNIKISATQSENHYNFQVVLIQQLLKKRYAKGYVELAVSGSLNNKPMRLSLADISLLTRKDLGFSFKYFQVLEGAITLPDNFIAEKIEIAAILTKSKWQKYQKLEQTNPWVLE